MCAISCGLRRCLLFRLYIKYAAEPRSGFVAVSPLLDARPGAFGLGCVRRARSSGNTYIMNGGGSLAKCRGGVGVQFQLGPAIPALKQN